MGQARLRKLFDPHYGKPKHRGLVVGTKTRIERNGGITTDGGLHPQELRFALLFWDKLVWPVNTFFLQTGCSESKLLQDCGVLERPQYRIEGSPAEVMLNAQLRAFHDYESKQPGAWGIMQGENSLHFADGILAPSLGASIELIRAVPIPTVETPVEAILEFKEKRIDEFLAFRAHIEALAKNVHGSADKSAELARHIADIQKACTDLTGVSKEFRFPMHRGNFKARLNLERSLVGKVMGAWQWGSTYGLEAAAVSAAAVGLHNMVKLEGVPGFQSIRNPKFPYNYAYHINNELI